MILKVFAGPGQEIPPFVKVGITVTVASIASKVVFTAVKAGISPIPDVPAPMSGLICQA